MKVIKYNQILGVSVFEINELNTDEHSHPAIEIISSYTDRFSVYGEGFQLIDISACLIKANSSHRVLAHQGTFSITMIDSTVMNELKILEEFQLSANALQSISLSTVKNIQQIESSQRYKNTYPNTIQKVITLIKKSTIEDIVSRTKLASVANLSPSRLSHLFKSATGITLSRYIQWHRMNIALGYIINNGSHLGNAALNSGYYDSAYFSKQFKSLFGVAPSFAYNNSTIIQK